MIDNAKHTIFKWIQKEHRIVANVQKTMVALLKTKIPTEITEARIELEQIVKEFPEVNSISRGGNVGCTSPPVFVGLSIIS
jgi:hypothetical protein